MSKDLIIVTAASSNHFRPLLNLLLSVTIWEPEASVVVYDLGLSESENHLLEKHGFPTRRFVFENYPSYFAIDRNSGQYAWKPIIVSEVFYEATRFILWLDAGSLILNHLVTLRNVLEESGVYSPLSGGTIRRWTHPETVKILNGNRFLKKQPRNAAAVGFHVTHHGAKWVIDQWKSGALSWECIAPNGSSRKNHRQDQAILSILLYDFECRYSEKLVDDLLDLAIQTDALSLQQITTLLGLP